MFRKQWITILAFCLFLILLCINLVHASPSDSSAYVNVTAATLWVQPNNTRDLDQPGLSAPVDLQKWIDSMEYTDKMWLVGKLETQALYGQKVKILEERGEWVKVAVEGQPTPRHTEGYPGWLPAAQLTFNRDLDHCVSQSFLIVKVPITRLYHEPTATFPFMEISFNTHLPVVEVKGEWISVTTPNDGVKWVSASTVTVHQKSAGVPVPASEELVTTAKQFLGLPYLWAGLSGFGFDCSGFTHTLYKSYGITIPRDASAQATAGIPVKKENLQPGDLLFFAYNNGSGRVHHVAMYIGNNQMIHSPKTGRSIEILSLTHSDYIHEYAGARRYLP